MPHVRVGADSTAEATVSAVVQGQPQQHTSSSTGEVETITNVAQAAAIQTGLFVLFYKSFLRKNLLLSSFLANIAIQQPPAHFHYHDINVVSFDGLTPHIKMSPSLPLFQVNSFSSLD